MSYLDYQELKIRGTFNFPIEFQHVDKYHPRYNMPLHWHIETEIIRVLSGSMQIHLDEDTYIINPGEIVFVQDGVLHGGKAFDCEYECIVFNLSEFLTESLACKDEILSIKNQQFILQNIFNKDEKVYGVLNEIFECIKAPRPGYEFIVQGLLTASIGSIIQQNAYKINVFYNIKSKNRIISIKKVLEKIKNEYSEKLTLNDLAKTANLSSKYFCKFFQEITNKTPIEYLKFYRIECAGRKLVSTDDSVTDIAFNCGFNNLSYFIKLFKKHFGVSPNQYRDLNS